MSTLLAYEILVAPYFCLTALGSSPNFLELGYPYFEANMKFLNSGSKKTRSPRTDLGGGGARTPFSLLRDLTPCRPKGSPFGIF